MSVAEHTKHHSKGKSHIEYVFRCPMCGEIFTRRKSNLAKKFKIKIRCWSRYCSVKLQQKIRYNEITEEEYQKMMDENLIEEKEVFIE